jgi:hypothetical protein
VPAETTAYTATPAKLHADGLVNESGATSGERPAHFIFENKLKAEDMSGAIPEELFYLLKYLCRQIAEIKSQGAGATMNIDQLPKPIDGEDVGFSLRLLLRATMRDCGGLE